MTVSTIVTWLIGLVLGAVLTGALSGLGGSRFSLQLCPIPRVAADSAGVARDLQDPSGSRRHE
jgi:hypothetical protein